MCALIYINDKPCIFICFGEKKSECTGIPNFRSFALLSFSGFLKHFLGDTCNNTAKKPTRSTLPRHVLSNITWKNWCIGL